MTKVFVSYAYEDKSFAVKLVSELQSYSINTWIDELEMRPGDSLFKKIPVEIEKSDYLIVVLSPNSVESKWVKREVRLALKEENTVCRIKVIPLLYTQCEVPRFLVGKIWADFTNSFSGGLINLLRGIFRGKEIFSYRIGHDSVFKADAEAVEHVVSFLIKTNKPKDFLIVYDDDGFENELQSIWWTEKDIKEMNGLNNEQVNTFMHSVIRNKNAVPFLIKNYALVLPKYIFSAFSYFGKDVVTSHLICESVETLTKKLFLLIAEKIVAYGNPDKVRSMRSINGENLLAEDERVTDSVRKGCYGFESYVFGCDLDKMLYLGLRGREDISDSEKKIYDATVVVPQEAIPKDTRDFLGFYPLPPDNEIFGNMWVKFFMPEIACLHITSCSYSGQFITKYLNRIGLRKNDYFHFGYE